MNEGGASPTVRTPFGERRRIKKEEPSGKEVRGNERRREA